MHLYDVDVPGKIKFQESEFLNPGNGFLTFETGTLVLMKTVLYMYHSVVYLLLFRMVQNWSGYLLRHKISRASVSLQPER